MISTLGDLRVVNISAEPGDRIEVFGSLVDNTTVVAERTVVYSKFDFYAMFIRSLAGLAILVFLFFRFWRVEKWRVVEA